LRPIGRSMRKQLYGRYRARDSEERRQRRDDSRDRDRRRDSSRDRSPGRKRSRDDDDDGDGKVSARGMSDDARRAMFAQWNAEASE
jgi:hypothetical protein